MQITPVVGGWSDETPAWRVRRRGGASSSLRRSSRSSESASSVAAGTSAAVTCERRSFLNVRFFHTVVFEEEKNRGF